MSRAAVKNPPSPHSSAAGAKTTAPSPIPADFLRFSPKEPRASECVDKARVNGTWIALLQPPASWPSPLLKEYQQDLYFLFPKAFRTESYNSKDLVCLCATVTNCPKKNIGQQENRVCTEYRRGLCVEASMEANDCQPLALGSIARFHGLSKQRVHQIYTSARKRLITDLANDETIQEFLADVFLGKRSLPTPDEIAAFIERAVQGHTSEKED
ncbi:MAG: hypothetical protein V1746_05210 [bacterium]